MAGQNYLQHQSCGSMVITIGFNQTSPIMENDESRILIRVNVKLIPGSTEARPWTLWELFCENHLHRKPLYKASTGAAAFDAIHVPRSFDTEEDEKIWFLFDVGVAHKKDQALVKEVSHEAYFASFDSASCEWYV